MKNIELLAINGSPRKKSETGLLLKEVLKHFDKKLFKTGIINLHNKKINHCLGCLSEGKCKFPCIIKDDFEIISRKIAEADVIIIGSPVYGCNVSSLMKACLDRIACLSRGGYSLKGKIGGVVCTGNIYGFTPSEYYMMNALNYRGVILPGKCTCEGRTTSEYGSILKDENAISSAKQLASSITDLCKRIY
jgi:multimeric flavodoxin WrbA